MRFKKYEVSVFGFKQCKITLSYCEVSRCLYSVFVLILPPGNRFPLNHQGSASHSLMVGQGLPGAHTSSNRNSGQVLLSECRILHTLML